MNMNRREFLLLTSAAFVGGCQAVSENKSSATRQRRMVNAGPVGNFAADGVYSGFRDLGFFLIRRGGNLFALSAICTHKKCKLKAEAGRSFYCPCHGSTFDPNGHVTEGPARRDLPVFATFVDSNRNLIVVVPAG